MCNYCPSRLVQSCYFATCLLLLALIPRKSFSLVLRHKTETEKIIRIGTRPSPLAQVEAKAVSDALLQQQRQQQQVAGDLNSKIRTQICKIQASGDHTDQKAGTQSFPLAVQGGTVGVVDFTGSLDEALLTNQIDIAVHSLKDIPPTDRWRRNNNGDRGVGGEKLLKIACHLPRDDPRDVLVGPYPSITDLPFKAKVGTSSIRRQAQLLALRPDLNLINLRGNVQTRLDALMKDGTVDALILAQAGLNRLRVAQEQQNQQSSSVNNNKLSQQESKRGNNAAVINNDDTHFSYYNPIPFDELLSGACQGIVAVVCRADDTVTIDCLKKINDQDANIAAAAERGYLNTLDSFTPKSYNNNNNESGTTSTSWTGRPPLAALMSKEKQQLATRTRRRRESIFMGIPRIIGQTRWIQSDKKTTSSKRTKYICR